MILEMHSDIYQKLQGPFLTPQLEVGMSLKCALEVKKEGPRVGDRSFKAPMTSYYTFG